MTSSDTGAQRTTRGHHRRRRGELRRLADARLRDVMQALVATCTPSPPRWGSPRMSGGPRSPPSRRPADITDAHRQEFILWSDALGISMLVDALANLRAPGATESTVLGPFYVPARPSSTMARTSR